MTENMTNTEKNIRICWAINGAVQMTVSEDIQLSGTNSSDVNPYAVQLESKQRQIEY